MPLSYGGRESVPYRRFAIRRRSALVVALTLALGLGLIGVLDRAALATDSSGSTDAQWTNARQQDWNASSADDSCKNESFAQVSGSSCVADVSAQCNFGHYDFNFKDTSIRIACNGISNLHNCDGHLHHTWCPVD